MDEEEIAALSNCKVVISPLRDACVNSPTASNCATDAQLVNGELEKTDRVSPIDVKIRTESETRCQMPEFEAIPCNDYRYFLQST